MSERLPEPLAAALAQRLQQLAADDVAARLWAADTTLWRADDAAHQRVISTALGWLSVYEDVRDQISELKAFADGVCADGYRHAVLLGMGGSSLAPEVMFLAWGAQLGYLTLIVLDTTDPAAIAAVEERIDLATTLFIVASKSGGTTETASLHAYFHKRVVDTLGEAEAGPHFIAITDEGTSLEHHAVEQNFRGVFINPSDIGGRYSALSFFGLVPAALFGADLATLLDRAESMAEDCGAEVAAADNPALRFGALLGELALAGRDKLTLVASPGIGTFGAWIEQLVAESTGKEQTGIFPVDLEPLAAPALYGDDRAFVYLRLEDGADAGQDRAVAALEAAGLPVVRLALDDAYDLGGQFILWELAVAVAGMILGIDPFDQPNVQESKDNTRRVLGEFAAHEACPLPSGPGGATVCYALEEEAALEPALRELLAGLAPPSYVALQAWVTPGDEARAELLAMRARLRDARRVATSDGFGPRFLHSTGQYHKGGPARGVFLQLFASGGPALHVPQTVHDFARLKEAQALGDLEALLAHGGRVLRVDLGEDVVAGLRRFDALLARALA